MIVGRDISPRPVAARRSPSAATTRPDRINPSREFFRTKPSQVVAILELLHQGNVVTAQVESQAEAKTDPEALESAVKDKRKMRPKIDYLQIGLKVGDVITFRDGVTTATIAGPHTVSYQC